MNPKTQPIPRVKHIPPLHPQMKRLAPQILNPPQPFRIPPLVFRRSPPDKSPQPNPPSLPTLQTPARIIHPHIPRPRAHSSKNPRTLRRQKPVSLLNPAEMKNPAPLRLQIRKRRRRKRPHHPSRLGIRTRRPAKQRHAKRPPFQPRRQPLPRQSRIRIRITLPRAEN